MSSADGTRAAAFATRAGSKSAAAIIGVGNGSVRQGLRILSDLTVQPVQLGETLFQMRQ